MKERKRMRGFDVARCIAFGELPKIKNVELVGRDGYTITLMHSKTGEILEMDCDPRYSNPMELCTNLAKAMNKVLKEYEKIEQYEAVRS